tara:strand:+ start:2670 stop:3197 length:528 start_codon:yes stop_codon:yes gene_type:complete
MLHQYKLGHHNKYVRRIHRELDILRTQYDVQLKKDKDNITRIYIFDEKQRFLMFVLPADYPFKPPSLCFYNHSTGELIENMKLFHKLSLFYTNYFKELNDEHVPNKCLLCCYQRPQWSPGNKLIVLLNDHKKIENWLYSIRSAYFGKRALNKQNKLIKEIIEIVIQYIYEPYPDI